MGLGSFEGCQSKKSWNQKILLAKIGADTAKNERKFAAILPKTGNYLAVDGRPVETHEDLVDAVERRLPGDVCELSVPPR